VINTNAKYKMRIVIGHIYLLYNISALGGGGLSPLIPHSGLCLGTYLGFNLRRSPRLPQYALSFKDLQRFIFVSAVVVVVIILQYSPIVILLCVSE